MNPDYTSTKRLIFFSARTRFASETQQARNDAIDRMVEQNLFVIDHPISIHELEALTRFWVAEGTHVLGIATLEKAVARLLEKGHILPMNEGPQPLYALSTGIRTHLSTELKAAEERIERVIHRLFGHVDEPSRYQAPFLEALSIIFSDLGETYIQILMDEKDDREIIESPTLAEAVEIICSKYSEIDQDELRGGLRAFFAGKEPDYGTVKWNFGQNYYLGKTLGLDEASFFLSRDQFENVTFYLDTNVLISLLGDEEYYRRSFESLMHAIRNLKIELAVCQVTLDELARVVDRWKRALEVRMAVNNQESDIPDWLIKAYDDEFDAHGIVDVDKLLSRLLSPVEPLSERYHVLIINDPWFEDAGDDPQLEELSRTVRKRARIRKSTAIARHDALLLWWIRHQRQVVGKRIWLLTQDSSLPGISSTERDQRRLAITLDALLQWLSPLAMQEITDESVSSMFAEALRDNLLPRTSLLTWDDLRFLEALSRSAKGMPEGNVEDALRYFRENAPALDPVDANDQQTLTQEIAKILVKAAENYPGELERVEKVNEQLRSRISALETAFDKHKLEELRTSAEIRFIILALVFVLIQLLIAYVAKAFGEGPTFPVRWVKLWPLVGTGVAGAVLFGRTYLGTERIELLPVGLQYLLLSKR